jgi:hypothetical protein
MLRPMALSKKRRLLVSVATYVHHAALAGDALISAAPMATLRASAGRLKASFDTMNLWVRLGFQSA